MHVSVDFPKISLPLQDLAAALKDLEDHQTKTSKQELRSKSFPRANKPRGEQGAGAPKRENDDRRYYEDDDNMFEMHDLQDVDYDNYRERKVREMEEKERHRDDRDDFGGRRDREYDPEDDDYEFDGPRTRRGWHDRDKR